MRPTLVAWAVDHGLPGWIVPNYFILVGLSSLIAFIIVLRLARRDGVDLSCQSQTLMVTYLATLGGGYALEALRMLPAAIAKGSILPMLQAGRSAYGGLLCALLCSALYLRWRRESVWAYLDRVGAQRGTASE